MLKRILGWIRSEPPIQVRVASEKPLLDLPTVAAPTMPNLVSGRLTHKKIYSFGATPSGQHSTKCPLCHDPGHHVFSIAVDEDDHQHRCCLRCLRRLGGDEQVKIAGKRSRYAKHAAKCIEALDLLRSEFPDPTSRPYGERALLAEIESPFMGYDGIERVLRKIRGRKWTPYELAKRDRGDKGLLVRATK
jgi:hypothetical protein